MRYCVVENTYTGWNVNTSIVHHQRGGSWCYICRGEIFSVMFAVSPQAVQWVTASQRACAALVSSTVPYVLAAVASLVCCCCFCSRSEHNSPCDSDLLAWQRSPLWLCEVTSTLTSQSEDSENLSDSRGRGKTVHHQAQSTALVNYSLPASIIR